MNNRPIHLRSLERQDYQKTWHEMLVFTEHRTAETPDEIWIVEHPPVFTLGLSGKREHLLNPGVIPIIQTDRGGQVTYHGPGQLVIYTLLDIKRLGLGVRQLVTILEQAMVSTLFQYGIKAVAHAKAPGVYVDDKKIGSVGLRIKRGCSYHGLSFNNMMDLAPFNNINTCGYPDLEVTQLSHLGVHVQLHELTVPIIHSIVNSIQ